MSDPITIDGRWVRFGVWAVICALILAAAVGGAMLLIFNPEEGETKEEREERLTTVVVETAKVTSRQIQLSSQGEARPEKTTSLAAEVSGRLISVDPAFEAGEVFVEGALLLQIDRADYQAALAASESTLSDAELSLKLEEVRKTQALRDWAKLGNGQEPSDLVKRVPQLASARSKVAAAQAAVDKALRDLERTEIRAPYDCRIERTYVDEGAVVAQGMPLADLVSRGTVEVRLPLSLEDYGYLQRDEAGRVEGKVTASGRIGGKTVKWQGELIRSEEIVEQRTRSINVVASFGAKGKSAPPLGMFVDAEIEGKTVEGVVEVGRASMLNGSEVLLVKEEEGTHVLEFRKVEVMRTEPGVIIVSAGLESGERIVVIPPPAPMPGVKVEVREKEEDAGEAGGNGKPRAESEKAPAPE